MLSQLSRGYGSWTAGYVDPTYGEKKTHPDRDHTLPEIDHDTHVHGVTVGARSGRSTAVSYVSTKKTKDTNSDSVALPKTYTTRKGALQLYVAPFDDEDDSENDEEYDRYALRPEYRIKHTAGQELIDLSLKLGTMGRLAMSVLNFGDQEYDKEQSSISDAKNKAFLKFLHSIDEQNIQNPYTDNSLRPGGDLNTYLQGLRSSSSLRNYSRSSTYVPKNREFLELQALLRDLESNSWPSSYQQDGFSDRQSSGQFTRSASRVSSRGGTPGLPSTPRSSYRVLSSKQLTASLKSTSYLGRPSSQFSVNDDDDIQSDIDYSLHSVTSAGLGKKPWTPENSTDELLIDKFFRGSSDDWETDEGNKRRRFKERSFITGSELLSQVDEVADEHSDILSKSNLKLRSKFSTDGESTVNEEADDTLSGIHRGTSASIADQFDAVDQSKLMPSGKKKGKKTEYAVLPPGKRPASPPEKMRIPDHLKEAMDRKTMQSYETLEKDLERMTALVDESLSGPTLEAVGEGLTEEELEIAKQILQKKIDAAKQQLDGKDVRGKGQKKKSISKPQKKGKKKKVEESKTEEELQREAIREKQALEKQRRDEEVKELQRKIAERRKLLQAQDDAAGAKAKELREQMEKLEQEAEDLQRAEDEARDILQEVRKKQREERDARRKAELERRKQDALDRREREKKELEEKKKKEMEMMEKIADAEMRRRLREEEERKMYEEERLAQERYEAELREAQRLEEEEEEKMRELERQAEEEAMQRLIEEREAAERQRRRLMEEEEVMREAERLKREQMLLEEQRLAEERQKIEDEEQRRRAREMERLMELRRAEEEAREKLQEELERRRSDALARRDYNLENKLHVDKLRHYQGITRAWTFSYFVKWPRETYEKPIGDGNQRKVKINNPAPKKVEAPAPNTEAPAEPTPQ